MDIDVGRVVKGTRFLNLRDIGDPVELAEAVSAVMPLPLVASGGAGRPEHLRDGLQAGADAALAASIFHDGCCTIGGVKTYLAQAGLVVWQ